MDSSEDKAHIKSNKRKTYDLDNIPVRVIDGIRNAKMDPKYDYLNKLLEEDHGGVKK